MSIVSDVSCKSLEELCSKPYDKRLSACEKIANKTLPDLFHLLYNDHSKCRCHPKTCSTFRFIPPWINIYRNLIVPESARILANREKIMTDFLHNLWWNWNVYYLLRFFPTLYSDEVVNISFFDWTADRCVSKSPNNITVALLSAHSHWTQEWHFFCLPPEHSYFTISTPQAQIHCVGLVEIPCFSSIPAPSATTKAVSPRQPIPGWPSLLVSASALDLMFWSACCFSLFFLFIHPPDTAGLTGVDKPVDGQPYLRPIANAAAAFLWESATNAYGLVLPTFGVFATSVGLVDVDIQLCNLILSFTLLSCKASRTSFLRLHSPCAQVRQVITVHSVSVTSELFDVIGKFFVRRCRTPLSFLVDKAKAVLFIL